jgi:GNAT superfamily N-acetyltransferase
MQRPLLTWRSSKFEVPTVRLRDQEREALGFLLPLSIDYPGIESWFVGKVIPGLKTGERLLLPVERDGKMIALGIAKKEASERKICTVRVAPAYVGRGLGVRVFDGLMKWLDDDRPHLTVNAAKLPAFERIFNYYGFNVTSEQEGRYRPHSVEVGFNEPVSHLVCANRRVIGEERPI